MSDNSKPDLFVVQNTRSVTVRLSEGVTVERFVELLNKRHVKISGDQLSDGYTGEVLGQRVLSVNASDYKAASDQCAMRCFDEADIYDFDYNQI